MLVQVVGPARESPGLRLQRDREREHAREPPRRRPRAPGVAAQDLPLVARGHAPHRRGESARALAGTIQVQQLYNYGCTKFG